MDSHEEIKLRTREDAVEIMCAICAAGQKTVRLVGGLWEHFDPHTGEGGRLCAASKLRTAWVSEAMANLLLLDVEPHGELPS